MGIIAFFTGGCQYVLVLWGNLVDVLREIHRRGISKVLVKTLPEIGRGQCPPARLRVQEASDAKEISRWGIPSAYFWCGRRDLNPYSVNHTPLKRARLPVPPLPHIKHLYFITRRRSPSGIYRGTPLKQCAYTSKLVLRGASHRRSAFRHFRI